MKKILVTYATRAGSTISVAHKIGYSLRAQHFVVDIKPVKLVEDIEQYDAFVIGSAIRFGGWLPEAIDFVKDNLWYLIDYPVIYYTTCITLAVDTPENRETVAQYIEPIRQILKPVEEGYFAGSLDMKSLSLPVRMLARGINAPRGDFRNYDDIHQWALGLVPLLQSQLETTT